MIKIYYQI